MSTTTKTVEPQAERVVLKMRRIMLITGLITAVSIMAVFGVIGYRLYTTAGKVYETSVGLPAGARFVSSQALGDRIVVTLEVRKGVTEIRTYDVRTMQQVGRLTFQPAQ